MSQSNFRFFSVSSLCLVACMLSACPSQKGSLFISAPSVFSRERLIKSRDLESAWFLKQLDAGQYDNFQGYQYNSSIQRIGAGVTVQFDPLSGASEANALASAKGDRQIDDLSREIKIAALQKQLDDVKSGAIKPGDIIYPSTTTPSRTDFTFANHSSNTRLSLPQSTVTSASGIGPALLNIDRLNDKKTYRDAVNAYRRDQELDDAHDLEGKTQYDLKFALTVTPVKGNKNFGKVKLEFGDCSKNKSGDPKLPCNESTDTNSITDGFYTNWVRTFADQVNEESLDMQRRASEGKFTDEEKIALIMKTKTSTSFSKIASKTKNKSITVLLSQAPTNEDDRFAIREYAAQFVIEKYKAMKDKIITISGLTPVLLGTETYYFIGIEKIESNTALEVFQTAVNKNSKAYVLAIDPKESAENLSSRAVKEKLHDYYLKALMTFTNAFLKAGVDLDYESRALAEQSGILRVPVLVGYADKDKSFGWVVGPRFHVNDDAEIEFEQRHIQHTVTASVAVPAWWTQMTLTASTGWLDDEGKFEECKKNNENKKDNESGNTEKVMTFKLPGDMKALSAALMEQYGINNHNPKAFQQNSSQYVVRVGQKASLLIRGTGLWRNPEIYIGSQKNNDVAMLPDMGGVVARFDSIDKLVHDGDKSNFVDLTVVTSKGISVLRNAVQILPAEKDEKKPEVLKLATPSVVASGELSFDIPNQSLFPSGYSALNVKVRKKGEPGWHAVTGKTEVTDKKLSCKLTFKKKPAWWNNMAEMEVGVFVVPRPNEKEESILAKPVSCVHFTAAKEAALRLEQQTLQVTRNASNDLKILLELPKKTDDNYPLYMAAYPGLEDALKKGSGLFLRVIQGGQVVKTLHMNQVIQDPVGQVEFNAASLSDSATTNGVNFNLELVYSDKTRIPVYDKLKVKMIEEKSKNI